MDVRSLTLHGVAEIWEGSFMPEQLVQLLTALEDHGSFSWCDFLV
jgi:hypothetical protein